jgi:hypothetical protein
MESIPIPSGASTNDQDLLTAIFAIQWLLGHAGASLLDVSIGSAAVHQLVSRSTMLREKCNRKKEAMVT